MSTRAWQSGEAVKAGLLAVVLATLVWSAIHPYKVGTWFFETIWVLIGLVLVLANWRRFPLTTLLCAVLALHAVALAYGGHYTYALTPLGDWLQDTLGLARNPYDRIGHFMQGFAPAIAAREILWRTSPLRHSRWLAPLTICVCLAFSAFWELMEWAGAYLVAGGSPSFLGAQGDPWDTQWDMALALLGAIVALLGLTRLHDRQLLALRDGLPAGSPAHGRAHGQARGEEQST
jgi:putative membrane protein